MISLNNILVKKLSENPKQFIVHIQDLIETVIYGYVRTGKLNLRDLREVQQQVNEELLKKIDKISIQYRGTAQVKTYFVAIIRNICNDLIRQHYRKPVVVDIKNTEIISCNNLTISRLLIMEEAFRLKKVINLFFKQKNKLTLCLKLKYRMICSFEDFLRYNGMIQEKDYLRFNEQVDPFMECSDQTIYNALSIVFNKYEDRKTEPDSLRKWVNSKIAELVEVMNEYPYSTYYNEDTLQLLFEFSNSVTSGERQPVINLS